MSALTVRRTCQKSKTVSRSKFLQSEEFSETDDSNYITVLIKLFKESGG